MKHLSRLDIEAIAEKYITAYMELPEVQDMPVYRIEPELFLERVLGLKIDYAHLFLRWHTSWEDHRLSRLWLM